MDLNRRDIYSEMNLYPWKMVKGCIIKKINYLKF